MDLDLFKSSERPRYQPSREPSHNSDTGIIGVSQVMIFSKMISEELCSNQSFSKTIGSSRFISDLFHL